MADIIRLLPDHVINQIAAGEVIQRPASAVKELLENAIDAGSGKIQLLIKDAGKTLIQVIDNGSGMNETDARLCFEKHATSKISSVDDIFSIRTNGFRGEALASIAAIAQVELKTRQPESDTATVIELEFGKVAKQEKCQWQQGSSFTIKNLFFNVPARKHFLKSDQVELRHIMEEFQRAALANPETEFSFYNQNKEIYHLPAGNLKQRIMGLFNNSYNEKLAPVSESTTILKITGFIGKPEYAKRIKGEQYFFVNRRFIRSNYLNHAVASSYEGLIAKDSYPSWFIFLETPPDKIDVNIHPTKTEIKFEDESAIYAILKATVKKSLGQYNMAPAMDFEQETAIVINPIRADTVIKPPLIRVNPDYNPFREETATAARTFDRRPSSKSIEAATEVLSAINKEFGREKAAPDAPPDSPENKAAWAKPITWSANWNEQYLLALSDSKLLVVDQKPAWERIYYDEAKEAIDRKQPSPVQKELFPQTLQFPAADFLLLLDLLPDLRYMGFDIAEFGKQTCIVYGVPPGMDSSLVQGLLEETLEAGRNGETKDLKKTGADVLARSYSRKMAARHFRLLKEEERLELLDRLFHCPNPDVSPDGKRIFAQLTTNDADQLLKK